MTDLSSPQMQRLFKSVHRLNISLYVVMLLIMLSGIGLAALMTTRFGSYYGGLDWAQITYIVLLSVTFLYALVVLALNLLTRKPYKEAMCAYIAGALGSRSSILAGGKNVEISLYLIADRLCVAKQGSEELIYIDLAPVKGYYSVCSRIISLVKKYLTAYYTANVQTGGYYSVVITDVIGTKAKIHKVAEGGAAVCDCTRNPFVKEGYISL